MPPPSNGPSPGGFDADAAILAFEAWARCVERRRFDQARRHAAELRAAGVSVCPLTPSSERRRDHEA